MDSYTSYVKDCLINARPDDTLFTIEDDGTCVPTIEGYAIIPLDEYFALLEVKNAAVQKPWMVAQNLN